MLDADARAEAEEAEEAEELHAGGRRKPSASDWPERAKDVKVAKGSEIDFGTAEIIGEVLAEQSSWLQSERLRPPDPRRAKQPRLTASWRFEQRKGQASRAKGSNKSSVNICERIAVFVVVFLFLLLCSAWLRLQSSDLLQEFADWAQDGQASEEDVCQDDE
mmetsp:Transcript_30666/g.63169  ORF Transcript_30666/g.63169 Transcript_30666/m.63169 type:complete len:162 (-) Transcript_30666:181-666(-)